jgi:SAM-dependent methyltransferase
MQPDEYRKLAEVEDTMWYFRALHRHAAALIRAHHPGVRGRLLDAGCGTGGFMRRANSWFPGLRFNGIDLYQVACEYAHSRGVHRIARASCTALPFGNESMAVVTSLDVLQHIPDDGKAVADIARVLEPGGLAVINVPAYQWLWSYHDDVTDTERRYTRGAMLKLLGSAGLEVVRSTYWNFLPLPVVVAKRKLLWRFVDTNDVKQYPALAERVLDAGMALERKWIARVGRLPAGSSVLVAARKPRKPVGNVR